MKGIRSTDRMVRDGQLFHGDRKNSGEEYEYRMMARLCLKEQEKAVVELNDSYFNHAEITLLGKDEYKTPELFFGNVVYQDTDTVFRYDSKNPKKLTGWLYRGVAGIELNLENVAPEVKRIDLVKLIPLIPG